MAKETPIIPIHQWTNGRKEVLIVRYANHDGTSSSKRWKDGEAVEDKPFQHPITVGDSVTANDWSPHEGCGGGIHGWPWGMSLGEGKECQWDARWQVYGVKPSDIVHLSGKVKFRTGKLRFLGDWHGAMMFVLNGQIAWVQQAARGASSATGDSRSGAHV